MKVELFLKKLRRGRGKFQKYVISKKLMRRVNCGQPVYTARPVYLLNEQNLLRDPLQYVAWRMTGKWVVPVRSLAKALGMTRQRINRIRKACRKEPGHDVELRRRILDTLELRK